MDTIDNFIGNEMRRQSVRHAVSRQITCPDTGNILDVDDAYLVENRKTGQLAVICGDAWRDLYKRTLAGTRFWETLEVWEGKTGTELDGTYRVDVSDPIAPTAIPRWKKTTVAIRTGGSGDVSVSAWKEASIPFLAIHKTTNPARKGTWNVTHVPTGFAVFTRFKSRAFAFRAAYAIHATLSVDEWKDTNAKRLASKLRERAGELLASFQRKGWTR